jgi:hypothetical protein
MKNNFDLKNYMKENKVGSYQQLNEMWYQDINQALGDFNVIKEEAIEETPLHPDTEEEDENGNTYFTEDDVKNNKIEWTSADFSPIAGIKVKKGDKGEIVSHDTDNQYLVKFNNHKFYAQKAKDFKGLEEMGGVKTIGDAGKMATPNSRPNLGRHRSSDMLDKMSKKDHKTNTVVGAKAAAYKAPHMKEDVNEIGGHGDAPDSPKLQAAAKYLVKNRDRYLTQDYFFPNGIRILSLKSDKDLYDYIVNNMHSDELYDVIAHMKSQIEKAMYANTDPNIADPINEDDDIFAGSDTAKWDNYGNEASEWDTEIAGQTVKGWTAEETQGGAIAWENPKYPNAHIYATPGWEGVDGIAFELHDSEDGYMDEPKIQKVIGSGTEAWKTKEGYMALMAKAFTVVEKMLIPSDNMAEDHGTQVNHDFNDDISMDYTEPEHMVQNEDEDPFGSIKTGIDQITQGDDGDMDMSDDDRFDQLGGDKIKAGIEGLMGDGFDYREILQFVKDTIASKRNY